MELIYKALRIVLDYCYLFSGNFIVAIFIFTLLSKIVLLPVTIWVQKNSIKLVKMQPEINAIKIKYFGDKDRIAEEEQRIYKLNGYNPFASVIPMVIQILLLIGLIGAIHQEIELGMIDLRVGNIDLSLIPAEAGGLYFLSPVIAGLSALALSISQNRANILQSESSNWTKYGTMAFSVALSLYLGFFVSVAIAIYWISSNLLSLVQQYIINAFINPKKYVDFEKLNETKKGLESLGSIGNKSKRKWNDPDAKRERADYKRFFSIENKHLVFYSEGSGFYKYFQGIIEYLLSNTKVTIHYITSDPNDKIFELSRQETKIKPYYISEKKLITLMMKMDADIVVMTMPDIENFHIKRSYVRKDIEYIFIPHSMCSLNLTMRKGSMDHYDTVFCSGKHQTEEALKTEEVYSLPKRKLVEWGYCLLDKMRADYNSMEKAQSDYNNMEKAGSGRKNILIAPSWQQGNIIDSCLEKILDSLKDENYSITVRPHPQHVRHQPEKMEYLKQKYAGADNITIQTDFSSNDTVFLADMMITDWSGIAYEYSFTTYKPVIFIDTPLKIMNPEYEKLGIDPFNIWIREKLGRVVKVEDADKTNEAVNDIMNRLDEYTDGIRKLAYEYVYNIDNSSKVGAEYIIDSLRDKIEARKKQ